MKQPRATPCDECPWRRVHRPGWLGPYNADEWIELAHSDEPIGCHKTVTEDDPEDDSDIRQCAGAAIYRMNVAKMPRDATKAAVLPADRETVFATPAEFKQHHERGGEK